MSYVLGPEVFYGIKTPNSYEWNMPGIFIGKLNTYWPDHFYTIGSGRFGSSLVRRCCGPCRRRGGGKLSRNHRRRSQSRTCKTRRTPRKPFNQVSTLLPIINTRNWLQCNWSILIRHGEPDSSVGSTSLGSFRIFLSHQKVSSSNSRWYFSIQRTLIRIPHSKHATMAFRGGKFGLSW